MHTVSVNRRAAARLERGHPWIFRSDLAAEPDAPPASVVRVQLASGKPLGTAHYSSTSQIALRMLAERDTLIDEAFLRERISAAIALRQRIVRDSDSYRVVYGEADFLPGLVVDRYADCLAIQTLSQGMYALQPVIVKVLSELLQPRAIVEKNEVQTRALEGLDLRSGILEGTIDGPIAIALNGLRFEVDLLGGQKTGFFLDQRENYAATRRFGRGRALDCFTYGGGFALHLASVCESVEAVDSSASAVARTSRNAEENGLGNVSVREADVFQLLASYQSARRGFDTIVLDPPAFTKSRGRKEEAARGYKEINLRALKLLVPGGVLVTCSCSHHVSAADLLDVVHEASCDTRRPLRLLETRSQAACHPIRVGVPETEYLKCFILEAS
ncbi:MAG: class I SAM-dependent rRNA methyltransferase [Bryobacterales bacterium]|nr:class I SAM-dependent rRNA methyltransferase [Bryobacterales bacterium]